MSIDLFPHALDAVHAVERAVRDADPCAFPVASRIVRRVIRNEIDLPTLSARVPHRKSFFLSAAQARPIVMNDELGLDAAAPLPETLILLARPEEHVLERMAAGELSEHYRRLHFHARIHLALDARRAAGALDDRTIARRIEQIGYSAFDEIRAVLSHEAYLFPEATTASIYVEFAAVFLELRYFAPDLLASYFPSFDDLDRVESILAEDVDAGAILAMTADLPAAEPSPETERTPGDAPPVEPAGRGPRTDRAFERMMRDANASAERGNHVRAAIQHARAAAISDPVKSARARASAERDVGRLAERLRRALALEAHAYAAWRELLAALLERATFGFWSPDARLLYDLQRVCLDYERDSYVIDLAGWLRSFGRRPLKRPLPAQREVLMSKHLRTATARVGKLRISAGRREQLSILLHEAAVSAEHRLRDRLRPLAAMTLGEVGFVPQNIPERVSFRIIVEELLDAVVERGFFAMGDIRDAIARNELKLDDVADLGELITGDRLLRADRRLADVLDGVYQRGPFYLRFLQGFSSCAFGTHWGRNATLYAAIPFGGAFVILAFLEHLVDASLRLQAWLTAEAAQTSADSTAPAAAAPEPSAGLTHPVFIIALGLFLLGLIHSPTFRAAAGRAARRTGRALRFVFVDFPVWLAEITFISRFLRGPVFVFFRRRLLTSLVLTALFCWLLPALGWYRAPKAGVTAGVFLGLAALLNSRAGRDIEELTAERLQLLWHRLRVRVLVALFDLVMDFFKQVLEWVERLLYEVDEWLRFKSGESQLMLAVKAVLGLPWSVARFIVRFLVTVLVEPQINPIKHFPVVTVSHKVILPLQPDLARQLVRVFGKVLANTVAGVIVLVLPGVVGFLVWEMRGNWRLYAANRRRDLRPVQVGSHGETVLRLLKLGVHSGTLPRLFARLRRAARRANPSRRLRDLAGYYARLHHVERDVKRFFDRQFLGYLAESRSFGDVPVSTGQIELGTNSVRVEICAPRLGDEALWIAFEEQSGWLAACIWKNGWIASLDMPRRSVMAGLLTGFYRMGAVELVREQIEASLGARARPYDLVEQGLVLLPGSGRTESIVYDLSESPEVTPRISGPGAPVAGPPVDSAALIFARTNTPWIDWVVGWALEQRGETFPDLLPGKAHPRVVLPAG